jgi:hypothetical protein
MKNIIEVINESKEAIELELGGYFDIVFEKDLTSVLVKSEGLYYVIKIEKGRDDYKIVIEDVTWIIEKATCKKKKQKYINDSMRKRIGH